MPKLQPVCKVEIITLRVIWVVLWFLSPIDIKKKKKKIKNKNEDSDPLTIDTH